MGGEEVKTTEVIGYDSSKQTYFTISFDNQGNAGAYLANLRDCLWTINGELERFMGEFSSDGNTLKGKWELLSDGSSWQPWMDIKLTKEII
ncbi:N-acetylneuraminic acid mutarotase [Cytobacillus purgationiresistens]|uniref:N-acetylneuraminic acid mutarotase n=2 Tax=Cytobacillus purgationiresistens TaxID=863449 RepID=A0ABU0ARA6_9BACI|nr:N-acetylneuraminic acid mutarotase [Cytobacillus purgationiresistens]